MITKRNPIKIRVQLYRKRSDFQYRISHFNMIIFFSSRLAGGPAKLALSLFAFVPCGQDMKLVPALLAATLRSTVFSGFS